MWSVINLTDSTLCIVQAVLSMHRKALPFNILNSCLSNVSRADTSLHCFDKCPTAATVAFRRFSLFDARCTVVKYLRKAITDRLSIYLKKKLFIYLFIYSFCVQDVFISKLKIQQNQNQFWKKKMRWMRQSFKRI